MTKQKGVEPQNWKCQLKDLSDFGEERSGQSGGKKDWLKRVSALKSLWVFSSTSKLFPNQGWVGIHQYKIEVNCEMWIKINFKQLNSFQALD